MDPQHKLSLLTTAEALENAGIDFEKLSGTDTGVFAGMPSFYYFIHILKFSFPLFLVQMFIISIIIIIFVI